MGKRAFASQFYAGLAQLFLQTCKVRLSFLFERLQSLLRCRLLQQLRQQLCLLTHSLLKRGQVVPLQ